MGLERIRLNMIHKAEANQSTNGKLTTAGAIETGFIDLDYVLGGLKRGETYLLGGRPGMGKTAFAMNLIEQIAVERNYCVAVFSLDKGRESYINSMLQLVSKVETRLYRKSFSRYFTEDVDAGISKLENARLYIDDTPGLNAVEMQVQLRKIEEPLDFFVVDYLQLMSHEMNMSFSAAIVNILMLSQIAKSENCPVLILSQISDAPDLREQHRPTIADLIETGIERYVDNLLFLYREDYYSQSMDRKVAAEIIIARNKHGNSGIVLLDWMQGNNRFCSN